MFKIRTFNAISVRGLERFPRQSYEVGSETGSADAMLLRSHKLQTDEISASVTAIARAGAGVNNIPVSHCTERGIPVFNTPGANANAVKELVAAGLLLASRDILGGIDFVNSLPEDLDEQAMGPLLEAEKKRFAGAELKGKTLGVLGLGAIGSLVAQLGLELGMDVIGYDPAISIEAAWQLPSSVKRMENMQALFSRADYISIHVPAIESTHHLINQDTLKYFRADTCLLNFAREQIVDTEAVTAALDNKELGRYITDFPHPLLRGRKDCILMPHIGASTAEAEENCAIMGANQVRAFLEHGNIRNSVNFPRLELERTTGSRIAITNTNLPGTLSHILAAIGDSQINVVDLLNKSRDEIAYNLIDLNTTPTADLLEQLRGIEGVINVRCIPDQAAD